MTICTDLGLTPVKPYALGKSTQPPTIQETCAGLVYGVELEIENIPNWDGMAVSGMRSTEDGSLRNSGREFITHPMTLHTLAFVLQTFFGKNKLTDNNYSERCSVHIHANIQDLSWDELESLCMVYQVMERALFSWIGHDRDQNIFCTPWAQTNITHDVVSMIRRHRHAALRNWQKYTGLNLLPVLTQGTVEFRHMEGTHNVTRILDWARIIGCLFSWARRFPGDKGMDTLLSLSNIQSIAAFVPEVMGPLSNSFLSPSMLDMIQESVLDVKYLVLSQKEAKKKEEKKPQPNTPEERWWTGGFADTGVVAVDAAQMEDQYIQAVRDMREAARGRSQPVPPPVPAPVRTAAERFDDMIVREQLRLAAERFRRGAALIPDDRIIDTERNV